MKNSKFLYSIVYLSIFLFFIISPTFVLAQEEVECAKAKVQDVTLEVGIGVDHVAGLSAYIAQAYKFIIGAVGIFAAVKIIIAGLMWSSAAGNSEMLSQAKAHLIAALTGLLIALLSYILLNTLNTWFINLKTIEPCLVFVEGAACNDIVDDGETSTEVPNDNKCPTGQTCKSTGKCSDGSEEDECTKPADCASKNCNGGKCEKNVECPGGEICGSGLVCAEGEKCGEKEVEGYGTMETCVSC